MPLPSLLNGAKQCQVTSKRSKQRCKNLAAFGCKVCRMHGAHKSRNVLRGEDHPNYKNGERTKESEIKHRVSSVTLLTLRDIGDHLNMFTGGHSVGRKPDGYKKHNLNKHEELILAILKTFREK